MMNQMYRVVWNKTRNMYVVVSELASTVSGKAVKAGVLGAVLAVTAFVGPVHATLNEAGTGNDNNIAFGAGSNASGKNSTVIGPNANTNGQNAIAIGTGASAGSTGTEAQSGVAIGGSANAKSNRAVAVGDSAQASWYGTALGSRSIAAANSVAIGGGGSADQSYAVASLGNSVALGSFARTTAGVATKDALVTSDDTTLKLTNFAGDKLEKGTGFVLSVGDKGKERQIQNVAAGRVTAGSTDAMNGSQLYSTLATLANVAGSVKNIVGGDAKVDENGKITVTNMGGTGKSTISDAIKAGKTEVAEDKNVTVTKDKGTDGQAIYKVAVKDDITLNSVTTGATKMDANGLSIGDKNYVSADGLNANEQVIKNVGAGKVAAGSKDAVNGNQLYEVDEKVTELGQKVAKVKNTAESLKTALGGNAKINNDGSVTVTNIGGTGKDTVDAAIQAVKTEVKAGANVTVTPSTDGTDGHPIYTVAVNKDLTVDTVTTGATKVDTNGLSIGGKTYVSADGLNANNQAIKNVGNGAVTADSTEAVNGAQLHTVDEKVNELGKKVAKVKNTAESLKTALGSNAKINDDGSVTVTKIGGTNKNTVEL